MRRPDPRRKPPRRLFRRPDPEPDPRWEAVPTRIDRAGDVVVTIYRPDGRPSTERVCELVAETFLGPCPPGYEVRFRDGNKTNVQVGNLYYAPMGD